MLLENSFKGLNDVWRYLLGIFMVFMGYFVGQLPLYGVMYYRLATDSTLGTNDLLNFDQTMDFGLLGISKNMGFLLLIVMFIFALGALFLVVTRLHLKNFKDVITSRSSIDFKKVLFGFGLWMLLTLGMEGLNYLASPDNYTFRWSGGSFIVLVFISFLFLPIQTSFEELFFRGYMMQFFGFFARNRWVPILGSSVLFGLVHGTNPEVAQYGFWTMQVYYVLAGLFLAIITVIDDGMELALGVHAATNIAGATFFTYKGSVLQTDTLFITEEIKPWLMILGFILASVVFILICRKKFSWPLVSYLVQNIGEESKVDVAYK